MKRIITNLCILFTYFIFLFCIGSSVVYAKESEETYEDHIAGIGKTLSEYSENMVKKENIDSSDDESSKQTDDTDSSSPYDNIVIAQVKSYVNIRNKATTDGEILGKIYNNSSGTILETVDGEDGKWYKIESGSVTGYVKSDYFVTGKDAEQIAKKAGTVKCKITTATLRVREEANIDSKILSLINQGETYKVLKEIDTETDQSFIQIQLTNATTGYISADYAEVFVTFNKAISIEEEKANEQKKQQTTKSTTEKSGASSKSNGSGGSGDTGQNQKTSGNGNIGSLIATTAQKYVGWLPYVWGGTSLSSGADCSGFTQKIYSMYGISIPRTSKEQSVSGKTISTSSLQMGDLIFYGSPVNHVAIYIGNGQICHEANSRRDCTIDNMYYDKITKCVTYLH